MRKQLLQAGLIISTFFASFSIAYSIPVNNTISLYINNKLIDTTAMPPVNLDGRVVVPAREVFEPMGSIVEWKPEEKKAYVLYQETLLVLEVGKKEAWLNGKVMPLDMPAQIINGKIMLPIRFVSETMGFDVLWQEMTQSIYVASQYAVPVVTDPAVMDPVFTDPIFTDPIVTDPIATDPIVTDPVVTDLIVTDPVVTDPIVTDPIVADPIVTDPVVTDPIVTDPTVMDPIVTGQQYEFDYLVYNEYTNTLAIRKQNNIQLSDISIDDLYRERKIVIDLNDNYSDVYYDLTYEGLPGSITGINVLSLDTTKITLKESTVKAVDTYEDEEYIYVQLVRPKDKYSKIIVIDAGHGGVDPGTSANGTKEKDLNLRYALEAYELLKANTDIKVYMNREEDVTLPLNQRTLIANQVEADMFVSIHVNSVGKKEINGVEVFYYTDSSQGKQLAELALNNMVYYTGMAGTRGAKANKTYQVIITSKMPAILIETGFITNPSDYERLISDEFAENTGYAVYRTVVEAYDQIFYW